MFKRNAGFTLVEMVAVVAMVGLLASISLPVLSIAKKRNQEIELRGALRTIRNALDDYKAASDTGKVEKNAHATGYPAQLALLVDGVPDITTPDRRLRFFLRRLPRDPFADPLLPAELTWGLRSSQSPHDAPEAGLDVFDVYSLSSDKALDGTRYSQW